MAKFMTHSVRISLVGVALVASVLLAGLFNPPKAEAAGWSYVNTWAGKKYYACKHTNTSGRVKVANTTGSRLTFKISGSTYYVAAYGTTYVSLNKSSSFDVDGYRFSFSNSYQKC